MTTPYPFTSPDPSSSTSSEVASDSSPPSPTSDTTSDSSSTIRPHKYTVRRPTSPAEHIEPESNHQLLLPLHAGNASRRVCRPSLEHPHEETRLARSRFLSRNDPVLEPQSPPRRNDFPGKPAQGDPSATKPSEYSPVDGPRWSDDEYRRFLAAAMARKYPPDLDGMAAARARNEPLTRKQQYPIIAIAAAAAENDGSSTTPASGPRRLEGFFHTLDLLKEIKRGNRAEFGAWSATRNRLEKELADRAGALQGDFAVHVEHVWRAHHARRHGRVSEGRYQAAKRHHMGEMRHILRTAHDVAIVMGVLYSERAAVAQGAVPRHDGITKDEYHEGQRKAQTFILPPPPTLRPFSFVLLAYPPNHLSVKHSQLMRHLFPSQAVCDPLPYVYRLFPDFVPRPAGPPPDTMAPANPILPVQPGVLDTETLREAWGSRRGRLAPLHAATFEARWYDMLDLSKDGQDMAERVLAGGSWEEEMEEEVQGAREGRYAAEA